MCPDWNIKVVDVCFELLWNGGIKLRLRRMVRDLFSYLV